MHRNMSYRVKLTRLRETPEIKPAEAPESILRGSNYLEDVLVELMGSVSQRGNVGLVSFLS